MTSVSEKTLLFVPTYNERDNVEKLYREILGLSLGVDFLFIDDSSPDRTGEIIDRLAKENPAVTAIHRPGKLGIGGAHLDGISWAYDHGYTRLITMDCDFTHSPEYLKDFIREGAGHDVVIGSRHVLSESLAGWSLYRKTLTRAGYFLTRVLLGLPYDATGAYRYYRLDRIPGAIFSLVRSKHYGFFFESLYILCRNGYSIKEIPIVLPARTLGNSKMTARQMLRGVGHVFATAWASIWDPQRYVLKDGRPPSSPP
jgi:dolichol-phosphate mannosyltransferase